MPRQKSRRPVAKGYTRIDQPSTNSHGWFVRVGYFKRRDGTWKARHVAFFGDVTHGGKNKAKRAAEAYVAKAQREDRKAAAKPAPAPARKKTARRAARKTAKRATRRTKAAGRRKRR